MRARVQTAAALCAALLAACVQAPKPLYLWEDFPKLQYEALLREGGSVNNQIAAMDAHAERARGANAALPPGFRAHLGMLHLSLGNADQARQLWQAEKVAFPESAGYMDQLLKRLQTQATKSENPA